MIHIQSTGSLPSSHQCRAAIRLAAGLIVALATLGWSQPLHAQDIASAVPEFITLTEAELQTPAGAELASAQEAFRVSLGGNPVHSIEAAKAVVALTVEAYGAAHDYVARALTNLAIVQAANANFGAAVENYLAAIRARETASGAIVSRGVINPLLGLASAYTALDQVERAIPVYERAIHVSHVNDGPENLDQVEIIDALSRAYFFQGDLDAASDMQDTILRLIERQFESDSDQRIGSEQFIDALDQRAEWHMRVADYTKAVQTYRRLQRTITDQYGKDDPRLIEPLVAHAQAVIKMAKSDQEDGLPGFASRSALSYRTAERIDRLCRTGGCPGGILVQRSGRPGTRSGVDGNAYQEGRRAMVRAVRIARDHAEDNPEQLARTLVEQGDWLASLNELPLSRRAYKYAWNALNEDPALHDLRDQLFGAPTPITPVAFSPIYKQRKNEPDGPRQYPQQGHAEIAFDVDRLGRPENVRIVSADPAGLMDRFLRLEMRRLKFRPAFSDGQPHAVTGVTYRHTFRYDASRLTDEEREIIATTTYDEGARREAGQDNPETTRPELGTMGDAFATGEAGDTMPPPGAAPAEGAPPP